MPTIYEGNEPYIFVSYAHKDKAKVMRYINALIDRGFRVWFDAGIEAGSEWPEYIATHLVNCSCMLAFLTGNFIDSDNCRRELNLAQNKRKDVLNVFIQDIELPLGLQLQLGLNQAMYLQNFSSEEAFLDELCKARLIVNCRSKDNPLVATQAPKQDSFLKQDPLLKDNPFMTELENNLRNKEPIPKPVSNPVPKTEPKPVPKAEPKPVPKPEPKSEPKPEPKLEPKPKPKPEPKPESKSEPKPEPTLLEKKLYRRSRILGTVGSFMELSYIPLSLRLLSYLTEQGISGLKLFGLMIIPHTVIALILKILFLLQHHAEKVHNLWRDAPLSYFPVQLCYVVATIGSVIGMVGTLSTDISFIMRLLLAVGLNLVPGFFAYHFYRRLYH